MPHTTHSTTCTLSKLASSDSARSGVDAVWRPRYSGVSALLLTVALVGCGGGGSIDNHIAGPAPTPAAAPAPAPEAAPAPAAQTSSLTGQVVAVPTPVTVTLQLIDATNPSHSVVLSTTATDAGHFSISAPSAVIPKESQIAAAITADGYLPTTVIYSTDASGALTPVIAISASGDQLASEPIVLAPTEPGVFAFPGLDILGRLGDGVFSGLVNSKFQLPAPPMDQPVTMLSSQRVAYTDASKVQLQVSLLTRGLQASVCPGANLRLRSFNSASVESQPQEQPLTNSPENGDFSPQMFWFALDPALVGGKLQLELTTGDCGDNFDDVEVVGAIGTLK